MNAVKTPWLAALIGIIAVSAVAVVGSWRRRPEQGCALDGSNIEKIYRVEVVDRDGIHNFCCVACAPVDRASQAGAAAGGACHR